MRTIVRTAVVGGIALASLAAPSSAMAKQATASQEYTCSVQQAFGGGLPDAVKVALAIDDVPSSVTPNQDVKLAGTATFTFSSQFVSTFGLFLASEALISSGSFGPVVRHSGAERRLFAETFESEKGRVTQPYVVRVPLKLAPFRVSGGGTLDIVMPSKGMDNTVGAEPADVAFTIEFTTNSPVFGTRNVACWIPDGNAATVARVPVAGGSTRAPGASSGSLLGSGSVSDSDSGSLFGDSDDDDDDDVTAADAPSSVDSALDAPAATEAVATSATGTALASATIPPNTRMAGLFIPGWLVLFVLAIPAAAVFATGLHLRRRLVLARAAAGRADSMRERLRSRR